MKAKSIFICVYTLFKAKTLSKLVKNGRKYLSLMPNLQKEKYFYHLCELGQDRLELAFELSLTLVKICCIGLYNSTSFYLLACLPAYLATCLLAYLLTCLLV